MDVLPNSRGKKKKGGERREKQMGRSGRDDAPKSSREDVKRECWQCAPLFDPQATRSLLPAPVHL